MNEEEEMKDIAWNQRITFKDGTITSGNNPIGENKKHFDEIDFSGKRVLDVGCSDGFHSFYAEGRGAEVVSVDICAEQYGPQKRFIDDWKYWSRGYLFAHKKLGSKNKYIFPFSVYDLSKSKFGKFDIVFCLGLLYHLIHPAYALEKINEVMEVGSLLFVDSEITPHATVFLEANTRYLGDLTNFWIFRKECLVGLLNINGFEVVKEYHNQVSRLGLILKKVGEPDSRYSVKGRYTSVEKRETNFLNGGTVK